MTQSHSPVVDAQPGEEKKPKGFARLLGVFDTTAKTITTITALVVAIAGAWAAIHALNGGDSATTDGNSGSDAIVAKQVAVCKHNHGMSKDHQQLQIRIGQTGSATCEWPAPTYAEADGYSVVSTTFNVPIADGSEATGTAYDVFTMEGCLSYAITYNFESQGDVEHIAPVTVTAGMVTSMGALGTPDTDAGLDTPLDANEVDVVHNDKSDFVDVRCNG